MDLYADTILDHYRHPRGKGPLPDATVTHEEINVSCGDKLTLRLRMKGDTIDAAAWDGEGCAISQAGMSLLFEDIEGKTKEELLALNKLYMEELLAVPVGPRRFKCAFLGLHTLKNAIRKMEGLEPQGWTETVQ